MAGKKGEYARVRLLLNIYIAVMVTVLGVAILNSVGTNNSQSKQIAEQARALAQANSRGALESCQRGNYVRGRINRVSNAVSLLLHRSVTTREEEGRPLTPDEKVFLKRILYELRPLNKLNCKKKYRHRNDARGT